MDAHLSVGLISSTHADERQHIPGVGIVDDTTAHSGASKCNDQPPKLKLAHLEYVDVTVNRIPQTMSALVDGGCQLNIINAAIIEPLTLISIGSISIRGIVGQPIQADLVKLRIQLDSKQNESCVNDEFITVVCATYENLDESLIITLPVSDQLYNALPCEYNIYREQATAMLMLNHPNLMELSL
jgi:hypothetical protein